MEAIFAPFYLHFQLKVCGVQKIGKQPPGLFCLDMCGNFCFLDCLQKFVDIEELAETEHWICGNCKTKQRSTKKFWIRRQTSFDFVFGKLSAAAAKQILRQMKTLPVKDQSSEDQSGTGKLPLPSYLKAVCYHSFKVGGTV